MKYLVFCFVLFLNFDLFSQAKKVRIKMVQYFPYCGGAKPNKDLKNTPNKAIAYSNKKLIVINEKLDVDSVTTDKSGYLKTKWDYGTYLLFEPWKYYERMPPGQDSTNINKECLKDEWKKEDLRIVVSKKTTTVANNITILKCPYLFPCLIKKHLPQ